MITWLFFRVAMVKFYGTIVALDGLLHLRKPTLKCLTMLEQISPILRNDKYFGEI